MADVCIIYATADAAPIPPAIESAFSDTWSIWWDAKIVSGDYRKAIEQALTAAGCVIAVWSAEAPKSATLHDELQIAFDAGVPVLPIRIHEVRPPLGYGVHQMTDFLGWAGESQRSELSVLKSRITNALEAHRAAKRRPLDLGLGEPSRLPVFFFSVSSYETQLSPQAAVDALDVFGAPTILVSAYDMVGTRRSKAMVRTLKRRRKKGGIVLLDSGNYEKWRREDETWQPELFREALLETPHDLAFCYDKLFPPANLDKIVGGIVRAVNRDAKYTKVPMLPIVHVPRLADGSYRADLAPELIRRVAEELRPLLIAIPERELGNGIFSRAATVLAIRESLRCLYFYQPIHVFGTGNPISIALLAAAGADSFDGLEWCRFAADANGARLYHFQHYELFQYQAKVATSPITASAALDNRVQYAGKAIFHNLDFYTNWIQELRSAIGDEKRLVEFMTELLPKGSMAQARDALPGVL